MNNLDLIWLTFAWVTIVSFVLGWLTPADNDRDLRPGLWASALIWGVATILALLASHVRFA